jgi:hypothetical protein
VSSDVLFYPAQQIGATSLQRHAEFTIDSKVSVSACVALTFAFYSPKTNEGTMAFEDFKVIRKTDRAFHFPRKGDPDYDMHGTEMQSGDEKKKNKKDVKAFQLKMEIDYKGEIVGTNSSGENGMVITVPNNGIVPGS